MSQNQLNANVVAGGGREVRVPPYAKLSLIPDGNAHPRAGELMVDFTGAWKAVEIHALDASGRCTPKDASKIWIADAESEEGPRYVFSFLPKTALTDAERVYFVAAKNDQKPKHLSMSPSSGVGYSLQADYWEAPVEELVVTIQYGPRNGEDNDTATFTATKTEWPERTA